MPDELLQLTAGVAVLGGLTIRGFVVTEVGEPDILLTVPVVLVSFVMATASGVKDFEALLRMLGTASAHDIKVLEVLTTLLVAVNGVVGVFKVGFPFKVS